MSATATRSCYLTTSEVASALNVSAATVRRLISSGALRSSRFGERAFIRVERRDLADFQDRARRWNA